jgi:hypothetical protein
MTSGVPWCLESVEAWWYNQGARRNGVRLCGDHRGFRAEQLAERVAEKLGASYTSRQAGQDLKKLRGKGRIEKVEGTRRCLAPTDGLSVSG